MAILFERIDTGETLAIDSQTGGKYFYAKLSAVINSSNMGTNSDRGQDYGWRLAPEQQAIIEEWEQDPQMIDKVSNYTKVQLDALTHSDFLAYLLYEQERGLSPERAYVTVRREKQAEYEARVEAIRAQKKVEQVPAFEYKEDATEQPVAEQPVAGKPVAGKPATKPVKK